LHLDFFPRFPPLHAEILGALRFQPISTSSKPLGPDVGVELRLALALYARVKVFPRASPCESDTAFETAGSYCNAENYMWVAV
jgi:hypothetical protein